MRNNQSTCLSLLEGGGGWLVTGLEAADLQAFKVCFEADECGHWLAVFQAADSAIIDFLHVRILNGQQQHRHIIA
jgi:hypothetical protein